MSDREHRLVYLDRSRNIEEGFIHTGWVEKCASENPVGRRGDPIHIGLSNIHENAARFALRIPGQADQHSGMKPITIRDDVDQRSDAMPITSGR